MNKKEKSDDEFYSWLAKILPTPEQVSESYWKEYDTDFIEKIMKFIENGTLNETEKDTKENST